MAGTITFSNMQYGPNPYFPDTGGGVFFMFDVNFDGAPPSQFTFEVNIVDQDGNVVRTLSGTIEDPQQSGNTAVVRWDGKDNYGNIVSVGGYGPTFSAYAPGYSPLMEKFCSGVQVLYHEPLHVLDLASEEPDYFSGGPHELDGPDTNVCLNNL